MAAGKIEMAKAMLKQGINIQIISSASGLSKKALIALVSGK